MNSRPNYVTVTTLIILGKIVQNFIKGVLGSFVLHLVFGLLAFGLVFLFTQEFGNASEELLLQMADAEDQEVQVMAFLSEARDQLGGWIAAVMGVSFVFSVAFLGLAQRTMPSTPTEAKSKFGLWVGLLVLVFILAVIWWWFAVGSPEAGYALIFSNYALIMIATFLLMLLGYYLSTALFVKSTMVPSVPVASLLRGK